jgi:hypothetical protein
MPMSRERFQALAEAYGGDVARWPDAERDAAAALMAGDPELAAQVLGPAGRLDAALDGWAALAVRPALREAILAAAPRPRRNRPLAAWALRLALGAGLAGAAASGLVAGAMLWSVSGEAAGDAVTAAMTSAEDLGDEAGLVEDV